MGFTPLYLTTAVPFAAAMLVVARLFPRPVSRTWLLFWLGAVVLTVAQVLQAVLPRSGVWDIAGTSVLLFVLASQIAYLRSGVRALAGRPSRPHSIVGGVWVGLAVTSVALPAYAGMRSTLSPAMIDEGLRGLLGLTLLWITVEGIAVTRSSEVRAVGPMVALVGILGWSVRSLAEPLAVWAGPGLTNAELTAMGVTSLTAITLIGVGSLLGVLALDRHVALEAQRTALRRDQLESLGRMAAGVAHDFNNILAVLSVSLDLVGEHMSTDTPDEDITLAQDAVDRGRDMVGQLLAFARQGSGGAEPVALSQRISAARPLLARATSSRHALHLMESENPHLVLIDPAGLDRAVLNLVVNAAEAMPEGGTVTVSVESRTLSAPTSVGEHILDAGTWQILSVADTGNGIPASVRDTIFDPFVTTKADGTGLGLATVAGIAREAGGSVRVDSSEHGTTFELWLPAMEGNAGA